ncbi:MAG: kynureninase [Bacteroidetes bacterium]|nr:kynureninase [Bacteroidota bacterium]MBU1371684.1 kynureninase [Bacteroidota bacterium]MBU1486083.1 kynureninase [Bacteroidota bacterium]MBU1759590.1 kynureninase [Bacteroidota bacterium]MBU2047323.1 kynureninase [Bacteroidota bacterium]
MQFKNSLEFAQSLDQQDTLSLFREQFLIPKVDGKDIIYLCGNSLGLQPKATQDELHQQLNVWQNHAVEGWFDSEQNWLNYHHEIKELLAPIVGAKPEEVTCMNSLTINLHLLLTSFYQPKGKRYKILMEAGAFPSDQYALESHVKTRGYAYADAVVEISPRAGEETLRTEDILAVIEQHRDDLALVMFGGINYYTGQFFDLAAITKAGHEIGALVGFDLAHAAGNVPIKLHDWGVDFACWCSYKYLNSGPGGIAGIFVHEKHFNSDLPRLAGWWGYQLNKRFKMEKGFVPETGAEGWQVSTSPILLMATHKAALKVMNDAGFENLRKKSVMLTSYLEFIIQKVNDQVGEEFLKIITPKNVAERGCQLSIICKRGGKTLFDALVAQNIIGDWRAPNVIRLSPIPLYNTFEEIYFLGQTLLNNLKTNC